MMTEEIKKPTKNPIKRFLDPRTQIVRRAKWYAIAPLSIIFIGLLVVLIFNFNLGLDFTGGRIVTVSNFAESESQQVQRIVQEEMQRESIYRTHLQIEERTGGGGTVISVRFPEPAVFDGLNHTEVNEILDRITAAINVRLTADGLVGPIEISGAETISPSASQERILNTFVAIALALIGILIYMLFRFKINSGVAAIVGLFHDVLVMAALVAIFQIQVNFVFVAAMITIIAYSLNNTLVLFDRVRTKEKDLENRMTTTQLVDASIKETFVRQLATTVTTIVPVAILAIFGVPLIREFAIPILFGLVAGFFSTIFVTSALYVRFEDARKRKLKAKLSTNTSSK